MKSISVLDAFGGSLLTLVENLYYDVRVIVVDKHLVEANIYVNLSILEALI